MQRGEERGVGNGLDSGCDVGNGLDRERVDVVVDDRGATRMQPGNRNGHGNQETTIMHSIMHSNGTRTSNPFYHDHD